MQAPEIGGVRVRQGDGSTVRLARGASLTDFADKINVDPAALVTVLFHLGEMATATQSLDEDTFGVLGSELGYDIAPVLASAGIAGVALSFGAQSLVKDYLSGIFMVAEDQLGIGDSVDLGEAIGTVENVGLRVTQVRDALQD